VGAGGWVSIIYSLGRKAHCAFGAACSFSVKLLLALSASFCWIRPLRFSAAKTRWDREHAFEACHRRQGGAGATLTEAAEGLLLAAVGGLLVLELACLTRQHRL